jgi:Zn-dependent metalloprotease
MKNLYLLLLFMVSGLGLSAQLKQVKFDPTVKISRDQTVLKSKPVVAYGDQKKFRTVDVKPIQSVQLLGVSTGLKPGFMTERNVPAYIEGTPDNPGSGSRSTEELAMDYLKAASPIMRISDPAAEFEILSSDTDDLGMTHVRARQVYKGIPVYGAEVIIHGRGRSFNFLNGIYYPTVDINITPGITAQASLSQVANDIGTYVQYSPEVKKLFSGLSEKNELTIYPFEGKMILVFHITTYKNLAERWEYFVDASTGKIVHKHLAICKFHNHSAGEKCDQTHSEETSSFLDGKATANAVDLFNISRLINTYQVGTKFYLIDGSRDMFASLPNQMPNDPEGVIWTIDAFNTSPAKDNFNYDHVTSSSNTWSNKTSVSAHFNGGTAYEYYRNIHNRKSINGTGGNIVALINVADEDGSSMGNAFWNGQAMFYGNGDNAFLPLARGLDVAGHEMTHGVVESTANLTYEGESGALNESFADIFGAMIDRDDWKIGEDVVKTSAFPSGALRDMQDPHNGAATNDFNRGWQPRHYDERYRGTEDNGGVHINSGIPNWAFFKFATAVGKDKAEKVYYRALTNYLTKSSKFVDCRVAVVKAATDLYGTAEINAAKTAFDQVGILGDQAGDYENDLDNNPGQEFVLVTGTNNTGLFVYDTNGNNLGQISATEVLSKPSVTDNGSEIIFVGTDKKIHYIFIDWNQTNITPQEQILGSSPVWRSAIISKDGLKIAAVTQDKVNEIQVFYFGGPSVTQNTFELYNPTYSQGVTTGDVLYADAMEFDITGENIMYDAENEISSSTAGSISYWDISFIKVWNNETNTFSLGKVSKLFSSLPEKVSVGNPVFSKNSPYIIAFDYLDESEFISIVGANIESGTASAIYNKNNTLGYPNFSSKDNKLIFDNENVTNNTFNLGIVNLKTSKIEAASNPALFISGRRWGVWFSNGQRVLSGTTEPGANTSETFSIRQNPVSETLVVDILKNLTHGASLSITDPAGKEIYRTGAIHAGVNVIDTVSLRPGLYFVTLRTAATPKTLTFVKQ